MLVDTRVKTATGTVQVLLKLCRHHRDLQGVLDGAALELRDALLEFEGHLQPSRAKTSKKLRSLRRRYRDPAVGNEQGTMAKALLLEIILRAASDWVLYRTHHRMRYREWANDAYTWLFEESPTHPNGRQRAANGKLLTSFISICEVLDFDPELVRLHVRSLTPQKIISMGRPAEYRRKRPRTTEHVDVADVRSFALSTYADDEDGAVESFTLSGSR